MESKKEFSPFDADPTPVPFREEWWDNTGSIANAIFWLNENWDKKLNAQGDFLDQHGRRWFWNYGWMAKALIVHISGERMTYEITADSMCLILDGNREMATYYRPYFTQDQTIRNGVPAVEWLKTREVRIFKNHHYDRVPLYLGVAYDNLNYKLDHQPLARFPKVKLGNLLVGKPASAKRQVMTLDQALGYEQVLSQLKVFRDVGLPFAEHHMHGYTALLTQIRKFNEAMDPDQSIEAYYNSGLNDEMNRLVKLGDAEGAALVDALNFKRTYEVSLKKTTLMVEALR